jgi:hypothetical protein
MYLCPSTILSEEEEEEEEIDELYYIDLVQI